MVRNVPDFYKVVLHKLLMAWLLEVSAAETKESIANL